MPICTTPEVFSTIYAVSVRRNTLLTAFCQWLIEQRPAVLPKSPMGQAIGYTLSDWPALGRYIEAGFLAIDNDRVQP
jgi:transposase